MTKEELERTARDLAIARQGLQATSLFLCEIAYSLADAMRQAADDQRKRRKPRKRKPARKPKAPRQ